MSLVKTMKSTADTTPPCKTAILDVNGLALHLSNLTHWARSVSYLSI